MSTLPSGPFCVRMCLCLGPHDKHSCGFVACQASERPVFSRIYAPACVYDMPRDEEFYDDFEDGCFDLVVLDEYKANKKIQFLNAWADGQPFPLRQKGRQSVKTDNLPLIIVSNYSIEEVYKPGVGRDALVDRFTQVFVDTSFVIDDPEHVE